MTLRGVVGTVGLLGALLALGLVIAPAPVSSIRPIGVLTETFPTESPELLLTGLGAVVGLGAATLAFSVSGDGRAGSMIDRPPEAVTARMPSRPGQAFDRHLDGDVDTSEAEEGGTDRNVRDALRETAIETLVRQRGVEHGEARAAVERGYWTADRVAAAFLGSPTQPLGARLRRWLDPERERRRRVNRTIEAIAQVQQ
ncbi:MAG: DUF7269 family protein [Halapricum sp.]